MASPYAGKSESEWASVTAQLVSEFPLSEEEIVWTVLSSWESIFETKFGREEIKIGVDIFPKPQIMGFLLHELIPITISKNNPNWTNDKTSSDKDLVYLPDDHYSVEIKTSSNPSKIFGNRSYAQETQTGKKDKSGYYLAINFEKFTGKKKPRILKIRFGWIDHDDWIGQKAQSGQQSRLPPAVEKYKLKTLYEIGETTIGCDLLQFDNSSH